MKPVFAAAAIAASATLLSAQVQLPAGAVPVLKVQKSVYMLPTGGANVTVQAGDDGVLLVDTGAAASTPGVVAAVRAISTRPIHTIVNTHLDADHTSGNLAFTKMRGAQAVRVMGHENTFNRMIDAAASVNSNVPRDSLPTNTYFTPTRDFFLNGEAIVLHHVSAHTDGDTIVHFRGSDVVVTGDVFTPGRYPVVDLASGGGSGSTWAPVSKPTTSPAWCSSTPSWRLRPVCARGRSASGCSAAGRRCSAAPRARSQVSSRSRRRAARSGPSVRSCSVSLPVSSPSGPSQA
jgi:glyoxylase-like metal-dependent hydrolase (beta-lactamase superfamily II)